MRQLINDHVLDMPPYRPGALAPEFENKPWVRLSANENPYSLPQSFHSTLARSLGNMNRYPDSSSLMLRQALAERHDVMPDQIIVGAGSTELIGMIVSAFLKSGEKVLTSESTFLMYRLATIIRFGLGALIETPLREDFILDLEAMKRRLSERVKLVFIANPNNPTGSYIPGSELSDLTGEMPKNTLLVIDNAYQDYVDEKDEADGLSLAKRFDNVIALRTFSKIFGLASLRIGYAVASARLVDYLNRVKPPFNVSGLAQSAALAMLGERDFLDKCVCHNREERLRVREGIMSLGVPVLPSQTNFLLFMPDGDAGKLCLRFRKEGILLRPASPFGLPGAIRVTIGRAEDNDRFLETLRKLI